MKVRFIADGVPGYVLPGHVLPGYVLPGYRPVRGPACESMGSDQIM